MIASENIPWDAPARRRPLCSSLRGRMPCRAFSSMKLSEKNMQVPEKEGPLRHWQRKLAYRKAPAEWPPSTRTPALKFFNSIFKPKKKLPSILQDIESNKQILRQESKDVGKEMYGSDHLRELAEEMVSTMRKAPGVGLAAPQIGVSLKIIVLEDKEEYMALQTERLREKLQRKAFSPIVICNPILKPIGKAGFRYWEGCLSVTAYQGLVERYTTVEVNGFDIDGKAITFQAKGWQARILQHECDHLRGLLFVDRALPDTVLKGRPPKELKIPLGDCQCAHKL